MIQYLIKRNIFLATLAAIGMALVSNFIFCQVAGYFFGMEIANLLNNVFDASSLMFYVTKSIKAYGKITKWNLPMIFGDLISLIA